jgi:hypothetical protein
VSAPPSPHYVKKSIKDANRRARRVLSADKIFGTGLHMEGRKREKVKKEKKKKVKRKLKCRFQVLLFFRGEGEGGYKH